MREASFAAALRLTVLTVTVNGFRVLDCMLSILDLDLACSCDFSLKAADWTAVSRFQTFGLFCKITLNPKP